MTGGLGSADLGLGWGGAVSSLYQSSSSLPQPSSPGIGACLVHVGCRRAADADVEMIEVAQKGRTLPSHPRSGPLASQRAFLIAGWTRTRSHFRVGRDPLYDFNLTIAPDFLVHGEIV